MENERQFERLKAIIKSDKVDYGFLCELFGKDCNDDENNYEEY